MEVVPVNSHVEYDAMNFSGSITPLNHPRKISKESKKQYEVQFPTGAMGLELEPVIISSERQLGCRVKDFYFDIDYQGLNPAVLQARVAIGDIISTINGESVNTLSFNDILSKLRQLRESKRVIGFKNITASGSSRKHSSDAETPPPSAKRSGKTPNGSMKQSKFLFADESMSQSPTTAKLVSGKVTDTSNGQITGQENQINFSKQSAPSLRSPARTPKNGSLQSPRAATGLGDRDLGLRSPPGFTVNGAVISPIKKPKESVNDTNNSNMAFSLMVSPMEVKGLSRSRSAGQGGDLSPHLAPTASSVATANGSSTTLAQSQLPPRPQSVSSGNVNNRTPSRFKTPSFNIYVDSPTASVAVPHSEEARFLHAKQHGLPTPNVRKSPAKFSVEATVTGRAEDDASVLSSGPLSSCDDGDEDSIADRRVEARTGGSVAMTTQTTPPAPDFRNIINKVSENISTSLLNVGSVVSVHALDTVDRMTTVISQQAERALHTTHEYLPVYNNAEMSRVVAKKHDLLTELSQSYVLLGQIEQRGQGELSIAQMENERLQMRVKTLEAEISIVRADQQQEQANIRQMASETERLAAENSQCLEEMAQSMANMRDLEQVLSVTQNSLEQERLQHAEECRQYEESIQVMDAEQSAIRGEMESAFQSAVTRLRDLEQLKDAAEVRAREAEAQKDSATAELEVLREMAATDRHAAEAEQHRLRENMAAQQDWHRERLLEKEDEVAVLHREMAELRARTSALTSVNAETEESKVSMQAQIMTLTAELSLVRQNNLKYKEQLASVNSKLDQSRQDNLDAASKIQEEASRYSSLEGERDSLSEKLKMAELNIQALHTELAATRADVELHVEALRTQRIESLAMQLKLNNSEETIATLKETSKAAAVEYTQAVAEKDVVIAQLNGQLMAKDSELVALSTQKATESELSSAEVTSLHATIQQLQASIEESKELFQLQLLQRDSVIAGLLADLDTEKKTTESLAAEKASLSDEVATLIGDSETRYSHFDSRILQMLDERQELLASHSATTSELHSEIQKLQASVRQLEGEQRELQVLVAEKDTLLSKNADKNHQLHSQLEQFRSQNGQLIAMQTGTLQEKDRLIISLQEQINLSKAEHERVLLEKNSLVEEKLRDIARLTAVVLTHEKDIGRMLEEREAFLRDTSAAAAKKEQEFLAAISLAEDMQDSLRSDLHERLQGLEKQLNQSQSALEESRSDCAGLRQQVATLQREQDEERRLFSAQLEALSADLSMKEAASDDKLRQLELQHAASSELLSVANAQISHLKESLAGQQADLARTEAHRAELHVAVDTLQTASAKYAAECSELESKKDELEGRVRTLLESVASLSATSATQKETVDKLTVRTAELQSAMKAQSANYEVTLATERSALDKAVTQHSACKASSITALNSCLSELQHCRAQLADTRSEVVTMSQVHGSIVSSLQSVKASEKTSSASFSAMQIKLQRTENRLSSSVAEKEAALKRVSAAESAAIDSEQKCVAACMRALTAEKAVSEMTSLQQGYLQSLSEMESALNASKAELQAAQDLVKALRMEAAEAAVAEAEYTAQIDGHKKAIHRLELRCQELAQKVALLEDMNAAASQNSSSELTHLQSKLQSLHKEKSALELTVSQLEFAQVESATAHDRAISKLRKEHEGILEGCRADRALVMQSYEARLNETTSLSEVKSAEALKQMDAQLSLQDSLHREEVSAVRASAEQAIAAYESTVVSLNAKIGKMREEMAVNAAKHEEMLQEFRSAMLAVKQELKQAHISVAAKEGTIIQLSGTVEKLHCDVRAANESFSAQSQILAMCEASLHSQESECAALRTKVAQLVQSEKEREIELNSMSTSSAALQMSVTAGNESISQLSARLSASLEETLIARREAEELRAQFTASQSDLTQFCEDKRVQLAKLAVELTKAKEARDSAVLALTTSDAKLMRSCTEVAQLTDAVACAEIQSTDLQDRIGQLSVYISGREEAVATLSVQLAQMTQKAVQLEQAVTRLTDEASVAVQGVVEKELAVSLLHKELLQLQHKLNANEQQLSTANSDLQTASQAVAEKEQKITLLVQDLGVLKAALSERDGNISLLSRELASMSEKNVAAINSSTMDVAALRDKLSVSEDALRLARQEIASWKTKLQDLMSTVLTQQRVLSEAEDREKEHAVYRSKLESVVSQFESRYKEVKAKLSAQELEFMQKEVRHETLIKGLESDLVRSRDVSARAESELKTKREELESLHHHVQLLLQSTADLRSSPLKVTHHPAVSPEGENSNSASTRMKARQQHIRLQHSQMPSSSLQQPIACKLPLGEIRLSAAEDEADADCEDKENVSRFAIQCDTRKKPVDPLSTTSTATSTPPRASATSNSEEVVVSPTSIAVFHSEEGAWLEELVGLSLEIHEAIVLLFVELTRDNRSNGSGGDSGKLLRTVSTKHHCLHDALVRPPWTATSAASSATGALVPDSVQSLTAAHELAESLNRRHSSPYAPQASLHSEGIACVDENSENHPHQPNDVVVDENCSIKRENNGSVGSSSVRFNVTATSTSITLSSKPAAQTRDIMNPFADLLSPPLKSKTPPKHASASAVSAQGVSHLLNYSYSSVPSPDRSRGSAMDESFDSVMSTASSDGIFNVSDDSIAFGSSYSNHFATTATAAEGEQQGDSEYEEEDSLFEILNRSR